MTQLEIKQSQDGPEVASRVLVVGLDGATWDILDPLIKDGRLPNLAGLIESGTRAVLQSTIPPVTASAWSSFYTGRNPGNHGIFDFRKRMGNESTKRNWINQSDISGPALWDILAVHGKTSGLTNLPLTYPPVVVNGYMIGGMPVPPATDEIGFPRGLVDEIIRETGAYISDVDLLRGASPDVKNPDKCFEFIEQVEKAVVTRGKAVGYLMDKHPADLTAVVLVTPDRLSHLFYQIFKTDKDVPHLESWELGLKDRMLSSLQKMDIIVGELCGRMGDDDLIVVMSDHGFGRLDEILKMNRLLQAMGFLEFNPEVDGSLRKKIGRLLPESLKKYLRKIVRSSSEKSADGEGGGFDPYALIKWSGTRAYSGGSVEQGVYINVRGREPFGLVQMGGEYHRVRDELIDRLRGEMHTDGTPLFDWVVPREEIFSGQFTDRAPDIMFSVRGYSMVIGEDAEFPVIGPWSQPRAGYHRREGILILKGPMIKTGMAITQKSIQDVCPTILACMGLEIDSNMDGSVITDPIDPAFLRKYPPRKREYVVSGRVAESSGQDDGDIEDLMKGLGYLN